MTSYEFTVFIFYFIFSCIVRSPTSMTYYMSNVKLDMEAIRGTTKLRDSKLNVTKIKLRYIILIG